MTELIRADASPEKRLFISLLTRDISLISALLDLIDNSINAAVEPLSDALRSADDYFSILGNEAVTPQVSIALKVSSKKIEITDTAQGISAATAADHVFKFGRGSQERNTQDRLSVYGIGLKRAMFKLGNRISMRSDHLNGGFDLKLNVAEWAADRSQPWSFSITPRPSASNNNCGTTITITELYDSVQRRLSDGVFEGQVRDALARTYAYYIGKFVTITLNGVEVEGTDIQIGSNHASETFQFDEVSCAVAAGIGVPQSGKFRERSSGWFVFCNGRAVVSADKSSLTGWDSTILPLFQPKHRPFLGIVFFVSADPEQLPWTTTKSGVNEDSAVWQGAKRQMAKVGRSVVNFLDGRYTDEGTDVPTKDLQHAAGQVSVSAMSAAVSKTRRFEPPKRAAAETQKIQYDANVEHVRRIARYLKRESMSGSEVGRHTFFYFLHNEVGEE